MTVKRRPDHHAPTRSRLYIKQRQAIARVKLTVQITPDLADGLRRVAALEARSVSDIIEDSAYQILQRFSLTIGCPGLQENAFSNSGIFTTTPLMRQRPGECGLVIAHSRSCFVSAVSSIP